MFGLVFISIVFSILGSLGIISVIAMFTIYRLTGGRKSLMWYLRHI